MPDYTSSFGAISTKLKKDMIFNVNVLEMNISTTYWKKWFLYNVENLRALTFKSSYMLLEHISVFMIKGITISVSMPVLGGI